MYFTICFPPPLCILVHFYNLPANKYPRNINSHAWNVFLPLRLLSKPPSRQCTSVQRIKPRESGRTSARIGFALTSPETVILGNAACNIPSLIPQTLLTLSPPVRTSWRFHRISKLRLMRERTNAWAWKYPKDLPERRVYSYLRAPPFHDPRTIARKMKTVGKRGEGRFRSATLERTKWKFDFYLLSTTFSFRDELKSTWIWIFEFPLYRHGAHGVCTISLGDQSSQVLT